MKRNNSSYDSLDGVFIRDLRLGEFEPNPFTLGFLKKLYNKTPAAYEVTLERLGGRQEQIKLLPGWTTQDYMYFLGMHSSDLALSGSKLAPGEIWVDEFKKRRFLSETVIKEVESLGKRDFHVVLNEFAKYGLLCTDPSMYPLNRRGPDETDTRSRLQCRWTSIVP